MFHPCGAGSIGFGVLISLIGSNLGRDVFADTTDHAVGIGEEGRELGVEFVQNLREFNKFRFGLVTTACNWNRIYLSIGIGNFYIARSIPLQITIARALPLILAIPLV